MTYGIGTRSYNRSSENHQMKQERKEATKRYLEIFGGIEVLTWVSCNCNQLPFPHVAHYEERELFDYHRSLHYEYTGGTGTAGDEKRKTKKQLSAPNGAPRGRKKNPR